MELFVNASGDQLSPVFAQEVEKATELLPLTERIEGIQGIFEPLQAMFPLLQDYSDFEI